MAHGDLKPDNFLMFQNHLYLGDGSSCHQVGASASSLLPINVSIRLRAAYDTIERPLDSKEQNKAIAASLLRPFAPDNNLIHVDAALSHRTMDGLHATGLNEEEFDLFVAMFNGEIDFAGFEAVRFRTF